MPGKIKNTYPDTKRYTREFIDKQNQVLKRNTLILLHVRCMFNGSMEAKKKLRI